MKSSNKDYDYEVIATLNGKIWEDGLHYSDYSRAAECAEHLKILRKNAVVYIVRTEWD